jgi:hypothetical protein
MSIGANIGTSNYIKGSKNPAHFKFSDLITPKELLLLYISCDPVHKMAYWLPAMALQAGWEFDAKDGTFDGFKNGKPFEFKKFMDWFRWSWSKRELLKAMSWSILFSKAILVGYIADDKPIIHEKSGKKYYGPILQGTQRITTWEAVWVYQTTIDGNGYKVYELDDNGYPEIYAVHKTNTDIDLYEKGVKNTSEEIFLFHKSRIVTLQFIGKEMGRDGTSGAQQIAHLALAQREMFQTVISICKNVQAGILAIREQNPADAAIIDTDLADTLSCMDVLRVSGNRPLKDYLDIIVPEMKVQQFEKLNLMLTKAIASSIGISIRQLGEEDIATGLGDVGGEISHAMTKFQIKDIQELYQRPIEEMIYLMGKEDSSFTWNEPFVKDEETLQTNTDSKQEENDTSNSPALDDKSDTVSEE